MPVTSCEEVARRLPAILDGGIAEEALLGHVEQCLPCRSELARYRRMLRLLGELAAERVALPEGFVSEVLAGVGEAAERQMIRSVLSHRRLAYSAAVLAASTTASAVVLVALVRRAAGRERGAESC